MLTYGHNLFAHNAWPNIDFWQGFLQFEEKQFSKVASLKHIEDVLTVDILIKAVCIFVKDKAVCQFKSSLNSPL